MMRRDHYIRVLSSSARLRYAARKARARWWRSSNSANRRWRQNSNPCWSGLGFSKKNGARIPMMVTMHREQEIAAGGPSGRKRPCGAETSQSAPAPVKAHWRIYSASARPEGNCRPDKRHVPPGGFCRAPFRKQQRDGRRQTVG